MCLFVEYESVNYPKHVEQHLYCVNEVMDRQVFVDMQREYPQQDVVYYVDNENNRDVKKQVYHI